MRRIFLSVFSTITILLSAGSDTTLFSIDHLKVSLEEFKMVYEKNNLSKEGFYSEASLKEYLDLYINFKLKVVDAVNSGFDTIPRIAEEIKKYKGQLSKSYLNEKEINDKLLKEVYERLKYEVHASHILIQVRQDGTPEDTLEAYNKMKQIRSKALKKGADFNALAKEYSQDPSAKDNAGDLGFFTALQMVYSFESMAYNTNIGAISPIFKSRFGYHIMKVHDKRENRGKVQVAHLFLKLPKGAGKEQSDKLGERAQALHQKIMLGGNFEQLVLEFSDDKSSSKKGGVLRSFGSGEMVKPFEDAAFALAADGDISKPIQTSYGFHILKRIKREPLGSFESMEAKLKKRVSKDSRSNIAEKAMISRIKKENKFKEYSKGLEAFIEGVDSSILTGKWNGKVNVKPETKLFKMAGKTFTAASLRDFIKKARKIKKGRDLAKVVQYYYSNFEMTVCKNIAKRQLASKYPEFKALLKEYNDGILLFEITDVKVWKKAVEDSSGLELFFENAKNRLNKDSDDTVGFHHIKQNYLWKKRMEADLYYCQDQELAISISEAIAKGDFNQLEFIENLNSSEAASLRIEKGLFEEGDSEHVDQTKWKIGPSAPMNLADGQFLVINNKEVKPSEFKSLKEIRGIVISDYQNQLEKDWITELKANHTISIDQEKLKEIVQ